MLVEWLTCTDCPTVFHKGGGGGGGLRTLTRNMAHCLVLQLLWLQLVLCAPSDSILNNCQSGENECVRTSIERLHVKQRILHRTARLWMLLSGVSASKTLNNFPRMCGYV